MVIKKILDKKRNDCIIFDKSKFMFYTLTVDNKKGLFDKPG